MTQPRSTPLVSVVIATFNRADLAARLLGELAEQTVPADRVEVVVVDDGSRVPAAQMLNALTLPFRLHVLTQSNAGPAAARHRALGHATGEVVVIVDDDMLVGPTFLAEHLAIHEGGAHRVALGRIRPPVGEPLPLFERCHLYLLEKLEADVRAGRAVLRGTHLYTGNVSFRRADYFAVGGFDPAFRLSEDAELGVRLERAGAEFLFATEAVSGHASDHRSLTGWMRRAASYGSADARVSEKHPQVTWANPWRFLFLMHPIARPGLLASALAPRVMRPVAWLAMYVSLGFDRLGAQRIALAGTTCVYGLQYFSGVGLHAGSPWSAVRGLARYVKARWAEVRGARQPSTEPQLRSSAP